MSDPAHQLKHRNLRPRAKADRKASGADTAVDIKLCAGFFVPSAGVLRHDEAEVQVAMNPVERQLTAMSVAYQSQINATAEFGDVVEHRRIMNQQNVDRIWYHQLFDLLQPPVDITLPVLASCLVYSDQIEGFVVQSNGGALLTQNADALRGEQAGDGIFDLSLLLVITEATDNAVRRAQSR